MPEDETPTPGSNTNPMLNDAAKEPSLEAEPSTPTTPTPAPAASTVEPAQNGMGMPTPKKSKKKWIIGGVAALVLVLVGGGAMAYFAWYQSPQKVLSDAMLNLLSEKYQAGTSKITASVKSEQVDISIAMDAKSTEKLAEATVDVDVNIKEGLDKPLSVNIKADAFVDVDKDVIYVKLKDIDSLVEKAVDAAIDAQLEQASLFGQQKPSAAEIAALRKQMLAQISPMVKKINNQWIKIDSSKDSESNKRQQCFTDAYSELRSNKATQDELLDVYKKNEFLEVKEKLPTKNGQIGYVLDLDKDKLEKFADAAEKTKIGKQLMKCDEDEATSSPFGPSTRSESDAEFKNTVIEVRVDQWAHTLNGVKVTTDIEDDGETAKLALDIAVEYKDVGELTPPKDAVDIEDLMNDLTSGALGGTSPAGIPAGISGPQSI